MNRSTPQIMADVLSITKETDRHGIGITKLCHKSNLSYNRLMRFIGRLTASGLMNIQFGKNYVITKNGILFLEQYKLLCDFAESYGLEI